MKNTNNHESYMYPAITKYNTWFIVRENGLEIEINVIGSIYKATHYLRDNEKSFIEENILKISPFKNLEYKLNANEV